MKTAVFLDRDGTLIEDPGYLNDPDQVRLRPGVGDAVRRINQSGSLAIVVTNQSGIARGLLTESQYLAIERQVDALLAEAGAHLEAHYFCPHLPEISGACECRKPGTLLYRQAAERFQIELEKSWWVGDRLRDVQPAATLGGRGILLRNQAYAEEPDTALRLGFSVVSDLPEAVERFILPPMPMRIAVAVSGRGSNLQALLDRLGGDAPARVALVLSNRGDAGALERARNQGIRAVVLDNPADGEEWLRYLEAASTDLLVLAGYLKLVPRAVVTRYRGRIINIHPALLPDFGGAGMYGAKVHAAVLASGARESGATVHVVDEEYDRGPILGQARVPVESGDTVETLAARVLEVEHRLLTAAVLAAARAGQPVAFSL
jgi:formyltetrahydrofolate-dependent phosphoribosylglycinamide formyltransferase